MKRTILIWEIVGAFFIIALGFVLHFVYEWTNFCKPIALFAAVNESVWEHLKLGFWPAILFSVIEYFFIRKHTNNFFTAKAANLLIIPLTIIILFYSYTDILGENYLVLDIVIFIIAVILGQYVSYKILTSNKLPYALENLSKIVILVLIIMFSTFTFYPPKLPLFEDPITGGFGI